MGAVAWSFWIDCVGFKPACLWFKYIGVGTNIRTVMFVMVFEMVWVGLVGYKFLRCLGCCFDGETRGWEFAFRLLGLGFGVLTRFGPGMRFYWFVLFYGVPVIAYSTVGLF